jgi:hypothetical protein
MLSKRAPPASSANVSPDEGIAYKPCSLYTFDWVLRTLNLNSKTPTHPTPFPTTSGTPVPPSTKTKKYLLRRLFALRFLSHQHQSHHRRKPHPSHRQARESKFSPWAKHPYGCLALVLLLDPLPRNVFRDEAEAYSSDE